MYDLHGIVDYVSGRETQDTMMTDYTAQLHILMSWVIIPRAVRMCECVGVRGSYLV